MKNLIFLFLLLILMGSNSFASEFTLLDSNMKDFLIPAKIEKNDHESNKLWGKWTNQDIILEVVWEGIHLLDIGTTLRVANDPQHYEEINPAMGKHPNREVVWLYMGLGAVVHPAVTYFLPRKIDLWGYEIPARTIFQGLTIGFSGACVVNNFRIGLTLSY